jgi:hypothetical protein
LEEPIILPDAFNKCTKDKYLWERLMEELIMLSDVKIIVNP